jgi:hypothetical protein
MTARKVTHENDHRINQSYFRDFETNRAIRIDSILTKEQALGIAALRGWDIVMWTNTEYTLKTENPGLLDRAFNFLRGNK